MHTGTLLENKNNNGGFSLPEILVSMGMTSILILVGASIFNMYVVSEQKLRTKMNFSQLTNEIHSNLSKENLCLTSLGSNLDYQGTLKIASLDGSPDLATVDQVTGGFKITKVQIENISETNPAAAPADNIKYGYLKIEATASDGVFVSTPMLLSKSLLISFTTNGGSITKCSASKALKDTADLTSSLAADLCAKVKASPASYNAIVIQNSGLVTNGTDGDDVILGTGGNDEIHGGGGNDIICGQGGNDIVDGGLGQDICDGTTKSSCEL